MTTRPIAVARRAVAWTRRRARGDQGQVTAFVAVITLALMLVAGLVLDAGLALSAKVQALDLAHAAARAGAQELDLALYRTTGQASLDPARAVAAADGWLAAAGAQGEASATTSARRSPASVTSVHSAVASCAVRTSRTS